VTPAETAGRFQLPRDELSHRLLGSHFAFDHKRLNAVLVEIFGCPPAHAIAENGSAVLQCRNDAGMTVRLVAVGCFAFALALALGMGCVGIGTQGGVPDLLAVDVEDDKTLGSAKVMRNRHAIDGSYRYLHVILLQYSLLQQLHGCTKSDGGTSPSVTRLAASALVGDSVRHRIDWRTTFCADSLGNRLGRTTSSSPSTSVPSFLFRTVEVLAVTLRTLGRPPGAKWQLPRVLTVDTPECSLFRHFDHSSFNSQGHTLYQRCRHLLVCRVDDSSERPSGNAHLVGSLLVVQPCDIG
jgi:hypothetical protein